MIKKYKGKYKDVNNTFFKIENNIIGNIYIYCKKGVLEWNKEDHDYYLYVSDGILANSYSIKLIRIMRCRFTMVERRCVTLTVCKELEVEIDDDQYEYEKVWVGDREDGYYAADRYIDENYVEELICEQIPGEIDGWEVLDIIVEQ